MCVTTTVRLDFEYWTTFLACTRITGAGDRALLGSNSSIDPGAGMAGAAQRPRSQQSHYGRNSVRSRRLEAEPLFRFSWNWRSYCVVRTPPIVLSSNSQDNAKRGARRERAPL